MSGSTTGSAAPAPGAGAAARANNPQQAGRLRFSNASKKFKSSDAYAVRGVDLEVAPGEFLVMVGPSGCGKSTLLNLAAGMLRPDEGEVTLDGKRITGPGPDRAMVFQEHGLFPWLNAAQNIEFGLKMAGMDRGERAARVEQALRMVGLSNAAAKLPHQLSGGMRQRVAIARALAVEPAVLLMDEPFAALDAQTRTLLHHQLHDLWLQTRKTILFVTHSVGEAVRLADRIIVLATQPGRIRREIRVGMGHPRDFDSPELAEIGGQVRFEIEEEVGRVARESGSFNEMDRGSSGVAGADRRVGGSLQDD